MRRGILRGALLVAGLLLMMGVSFPGVVHASHSFSRHVIEQGVNGNGAESIHPVDFDGDNDTDLVIAAFVADEFAWYERSDADSTVFTRHVIESGANANRAREIDPMDMDGDGDVDVVTAAGFADEFAWYESPIAGGGGGSGGGGGGGGGGCLIERSGLSDARLEMLRDLRDAVLQSVWGRRLTTFYYEGFGGSDASDPRP